MKHTIIATTALMAAALAGAAYAQAPAAAPAKPPAEYKTVMATTEIAKPPAEVMAQASSASVSLNGPQFALKHGAVVIAAITSCTNTSNPSVLLAAGLLAKKAVSKGRTSKPWV